MAGERSAQRGYEVRGAEGVALGAEYPEGVLRFSGFGLAPAAGALVRVPGGRAGANGRVGELPVCVVRFHRQAGGGWPGGRTHRTGPMLRAGSVSFSLRGRGPGTGRYAGRVGESSNVTSIASRRADLGELGVLMTLSIRGVNAHNNGRRGTVAELQNRERSVRLVRRLGTRLRGETNLAQLLAKG